MDWIRRPICHLFRNHTHDTVYRLSEGRFISPVDGSLIDATHERLFLFGEPIFRRVIAAHLISVSSYELVLAVGTHLSVSHVGRRAVLVSDLRLTSNVSFLLCH